VTGLKQTIIRGGLEGLYFSGAHHALKHFVGGVGAILTLHNVRPARPDKFQPNRLLEITPAFFARVIRLLRRSRVDLVSLDEMHRRLTEAEASVPESPCSRAALRARCTLMYTAIPRITKVSTPETSQP